jgi:hypothetical protein
VMPVIKSPTEQALQQTAAAFLVFRTSSSLGRPLLSLVVRRPMVELLAAARASDRTGLEARRGRGLARAVPRPVAGRARVAKFVVGILTRYWEDATLAWCEANGRAAVPSVARG